MVVDHAPKPVVPETSEITTKALIKPKLAPRLAAALQYSVCISPESSTRSEDTLDEISSNQESLDGLSDITVATGRWHHMAARIT